MKSFKAMMAEVAQPESEEEKAFKAQHVVKADKHPVALDHQHTGDIAKPKAKRKADQEGDAAYDLAYESVNEAEDAASPDESSMAMDQADFIAYVAKEMKEHLKSGKEFPEWMQNKLSKLQQAAQDLHGNFGAHGDDDMKQESYGKKVKKEELSPAQKKIDHNKNGKIDGQDLAMIRAKKKNESSCSTPKKMKEEVEELDELSNDTLRNYHGAAALDLRKKREKLSKGTLTTKDHKQGQNRVTGLNRAANKMEEVQESVETLDEAFKAGIVKFKDNTSMVVKKEDADILNTLFKKMSSGSVKKMTETAMANKKGFAEILDFAKEAM